VDEFKVALKKKANGKIKEEKPSIVALGSDKGGGKFNIPPIARVSSFTTQQEVGLKPSTQVLFPHCARKFVVV
jgi:hypothetical protein